jgi:hypothetical protein
VYDVDVCFLSRRFFFFALDWRRSTLCVRVERVRARRG